MAVDTLQAWDSGGGTKRCDSAMKAAGLGTQFKMSRFDLQESGNTIFEHGKESRLDRLTHMKLTPASQMPAGHDGTVDIENSFGELSLILKIPSSERSFRNRKNKKNPGRLSRSVASLKAGESILKRPTKLGKLQLTTHPNLPKVLKILSPSLSSGTTDGSANSRLVPGPNSATQCEKPSVTYAVLTPPKTFHSVLKKIDKIVDLAPRALAASSVQLDISGDSPRSARKHARYSCDDMGVKEISDVVTTVTRTSAGPAQKTHRKDADQVAQDHRALMHVHLGYSSGSSSWQQMRRSKHVTAIDSSECSESQECTRHPKRVVDEEVSLAASALRALSCAASDVPSSSTRPSSSSTRVSYSSDSGTDSYATVVSSDDEISAGRDTNGREVNEFRARGTSVLPRPSSKQRYRSVASLMDDSHERMEI